MRGPADRQPDDHRDYHPDDHLDDPKHNLGRASVPTGPPSANLHQVSPARRCSRTACSRPAVATLTYVYADSTAVLGPLAAYIEPHSYDLCAEHSTRLTAPRGWAVLRLTGPDPGPPQPSSDDLEALAKAVREAARGSRNDRAGGDDSTVLSRPRAHLRALPDPDA